MSVHDELMQLRIQRTRKLGEQPMTIKGLEDLLEATRQKIANQGYVVDDRLLSKERMLEQAVIDAHLDEPVTLQDLLTEYKD
jgi:hypothetical protein